MGEGEVGEPADGAAGGGLFPLSLFWPGGPVCEWLRSPRPLPGLEAGAWTGVAGAGGFGLGFERAGAGGGDVAADVNAIERVVSPQQNVVPMARG